MTRRIYCAALRLKDGRLVYGHRHGDCFLNVVTFLGKGGHHADAEQGFIDNGGLFVTREEAAVIATEAGQLRQQEVDRRTKERPPRQLYSEDIY